MKQKNIFVKKTSYINLKFFLILISLLSLFLIYNFKFKNYKYFIISINEEENYIIPIDRGGEKVKNLNKKILHLNHHEKIEFFENDISNLDYSIQLFASSNYEDVNKKLNIYLAKTDYIYKKDDFFIIIFKSAIGSEYLLLYKNFKSRKQAINHCVTYLFHLNKCLVVNAKLFKN